MFCLKWWNLHYSKTIFKTFLQCILSQCGFCMCTHCNVMISTSPPTRKFSPSQCQTPSDATDGSNHRWVTFHVLLLQGIYWTHLFSNGLSFCNREMAKSYYNEAVAVWPGCVSSKLCIVDYSTLSKICYIGMPLLFSLALQCKHWARNTIRHCEPVWFIDCPSAGWGEGDGGYRKQKISEKGYSLCTV